MPRGDSHPDMIRAVALDLFSTHGVTGTSLQMIADQLGVTKAAVYHHFHSKNQIVLSVLSPAFNTLRQIVESARLIPDASDRQQYLVENLADQAVKNRRLYAVMLHDTVVSQLMDADPELTAVFEELRDGLVGGDSTPVDQVKVAMFLTGLVAPVVDYHVAALPDQDIYAGIVAAGATLCHCLH